MKPRHAAALALVGWYLMVPSDFVLPDAHLGFEELLPGIGRDHWVVFSTYKSADMCADDLRFLLSHPQGLSKYAQRTHQPIEHVEWALLYGGACLRDDDPRLKEK